LNRYTPYGYIGVNSHPGLVMAEVTLHIEGMSCGHCLNAVSRALNGVPGIQVKTVQIGRAEVTIPGTTDPEQVAKVVSDAGYRATAVARE
jgi:copper chaperone CopZ